MKRVLCFWLVVMLLASKICVFAEASYTSLIEAVKADKSVDMSLIDEEQIIYAEITSYVNLDRGIKPTSFYLYMPSLNGKDYYTAGFDKNEYVATTKNFVATEPLKYYSVDEAIEFAVNNSLEEPTEIKAILTHGRIGLFAYSIVCNGEEYIVPYYFTTDSTYNVTNDNTVRLHLGTAYSVDEFVSISEKEHILYNEYMNAEGEKDNRPTASIDESGDKVINGNEQTASKRISIQEVSKNEDKEFYNSELKNVNDRKESLLNAVSAMNKESYLLISLRRSSENFGARYFYNETSNISEISNFVKGLFSLIESQIVGFDVIEPKNASSCCFRLQYKENGTVVQYEFDIQIENDRVIISEENLRPITVIVREPSKIVEYIYEQSKNKITTFDSTTSEDNSVDKQYGTINGMTKTDIIEFEFKNSTDNINYISKNVATSGKTVKAVFEKYKENKYKSTYILKLSGDLGEVSLWEMKQSSLSGDAEFFSNNIPISFGSYHRCDYEELIMYDTLAPYDNYELKLVFKDNDIYEVYFDNTKCYALKYTQLTEDKKLAEEFVEKDNEAIIREAKECADTLYDLGLFKGTDRGYELEKSLTREESATILVRLLGEEEKVNADDFEKIFVDVDKDRWSYAYVMYCYKHNITKGTGVDTFSPDVQIDANQFITLMMRLLGYTEVNPDTALEKCVEYKLLTKEKVEELKTKKVFTRSDMVQVVYNSLKTQMDNDTIFADYLLEKGVLTEMEIEQIK